MRNKILWSDQVRLELFGLNIRRKLATDHLLVNTISTVHGASSFMLGDVFQLHELSD